MISDLAQLLPQRLAVDLELGLAGAGEGAEPLQDLATVLAQTWCSGAKSWVAVVFLLRLRIRALDDERLPGELHSVLLVSPFEQGLTVDGFLNLGRKSPLTQNLRLQG